jgi:hypothetical protein
MRSRQGSFRLAISPCHKSLDADDCAWRDRDHRRFFRRQFGAAIALIVDRLRPVGLRGEAGTALGDDTRPDFLARRARGAILHTRPLLSASFEFADVYVFGGARIPARLKREVMSVFPLSVSAGTVQPGECYLSDTPMLRSHAGSQPDLFLRWNAVPLDVPAIDVVVHLHGFSRSGVSMPLSEKVVRSGLELARRTRPTLALLPRGNWLRFSWYDFPAMLGGGIDRLIDYAGARFAAAASIPRGVALDRLILTAHSGGGMPAVDAVAGAQRPPDELHLFDGLYGRDPAAGDPMRGLETIDRWLGERIAQEPARPGALRVVYIEQQTGPFSRKVGELIAKHLATFDSAAASLLRRRYRIERSAVQHARIAEHCGPELLSAADAEFDWSR